MKDEIKEILDYFRKYMSVDDCIRLSKIEDYITNLQTIEQQYSAILSENAELENIINELEKYLEEHSKIDFESSDIILHEQLALSFVYDYLKELKEGK